VCGSIHVLEAKKVRLKEINITKEPNVLKTTLKFSNGHKKVVEIYNFLQKYICI